MYQYTAQVLWWLYMQLYLHNNEDSMAERRGGHAGLVPDILLIY